MTQTQNLFDALDAAPLVCMLEDTPDVIYGPMDPVAAAEFCEKWDTFFAARNLPGKWIARPLLAPRT